MATTPAPYLVESIQVKATAQAGVFILVRPQDGPTLVAPMTTTEARTLAANLTAAAEAYDAAEAEACAND